MLPRASGSSGGKRDGSASELPRGVFFATGHFFFAGTLAPFLRASESPIAIACIRLVTRPPFPPLPDRSVPRFSRCIALLTLFAAAFPYFAINSSLLSDIVLSCFQAGHTVKSVDSELKRPVFRALERQSGPGM